MRDPLELARQRDRISQHRFRSIRRIKNVQGVFGHPTSLLFPPREDRSPGRLNSRHPLIAGQGGKHLTPTDRDRTDRATLAQQVVTDEDGALGASQIHRQPASVPAAKPPTTTRSDHHVTPNEHSTAHPHRRHVAVAPLLNPNQRPRGRPIRSVPPPACRRELGRRRPTYNVQSVILDRNNLKQRFPRNRRPNFIGGTGLVDTVSVRPSVQQVESSVFQISSHQRQIGEGQ